MDANDVEAMKKVFTKGALLDKALKSFDALQPRFARRCRRNGGRQRDKIRSLLARAAIRLGGGRHIANFIQKQGAAIGLFKAANASLGCSSKRALFVTEELTLN